MKTPSPLFLLGYAAASLAAVPEFVVGSSGATHSTLQQAVDACPKTGCRISLTDAGYSFSEPVSIRGKSDIEITGSRVGGSKPILKLDPSAFDLGDIPAGYNSEKGTYPVEWKRVFMIDSVVNADGSITYRNIHVSKGPEGKLSRFLLSAGRGTDGKPDPLRPAGWMAQSFLSPALFQVEDSKRIKISHLDFEGGVPVEYVLWNLYGSDSYRLSQYSGVAAISLNRSLQATIESCEFSGWSIAIRSVGNNPGGSVSDLIKAENGIYSGAMLPLSNPGAVGGHRIEGNLASGNALFLHMESEWDLASSVRFNRVWDNGRSRMVIGDWRAAIDDLEWGNYPGGFARLKDVIYPVNIFQGNTLVRNSVDLGTQMWRSSNSQIFMDNLSMRQDSLDAAHELSLKLGPNARNNWIAAAAAASATGNVEDSVIPFARNADPFLPAWGSLQVARKLVGKGYFGDDLGALWQSGRTPERIRIQDQTLGYVTRGTNAWKVLLPVVVEAGGELGSLLPSYARAQKSALVEDPISGISTSHPLVQVDLGKGVLTPGVNLISFEIPAAAKDSIWHFEMALTATDNNTGKTVHSNLGTWLLRPLGKQLEVKTDTLEVDPGAKVVFEVQVRDSLGQKSTLDSIPTMNAEGWSVTQAPAKTGATGSFAMTATAPSAEGVSQVVFWASEKGRSQAVAGAAYVKVGHSASSVLRTARGRSNWSVRSITRNGGTWSVELAGSVGTEFTRAIVMDLSGRRQELTIHRDGQRVFVRIPAGHGARLLRLDDRTVPLALVP